MSIKYRLTRPNAKFSPNNRATTGSAGYDLYTTETNIISDQDTAYIRTGVHLDMADCPGIYGLIAARSSLNKSYCLYIPAGIGIIDNDYQGELLIPVRKTSGRMFNTVTLPPTIAIAQIIFQAYQTPVFQQVEVFDLLTDRGEKGFGSTDKKKTWEITLSDRMPMSSIGPLHCMPMVPFG